MAANFKPAEDIPDLSGKVIMVTGGESRVQKTSCTGFPSTNLPKNSKQVTSI